MNNLSRRFVYPTTLLAFAACNALAEPVGVLRVPARGVFVHAGLSTADSVNDITQSSFADVAILAVRDTFSTARGRFATGDSGLSLLTASTGKVVSIETLSKIDPTVRTQTTVSDINSTDSVAADVAVSTATNSGDPVVAEASAVVSGVVDPANMSIATISTQSASTQTSSAELTGSGFNSDPVSGSPEPSTLLLAGSMLVGFAMFRFKGSKRG